MSNRRIVTIRELADEIGMDYLQAVELHRRINRRVLDEDVICITKTIGTFYRKRTRATTKTLNGIVHNVPPKESVALRGPRFPWLPEPEVSYRNERLFGTSSNVDLYPREFTRLLRYDFGSGEEDVFRITFNAQGVRQAAIPGGGGFFGGDEMTFAFEVLSQRIGFASVTFEGSNKTRDLSAQSPDIVFERTAGAGYFSGELIPVSYQLTPVSENTRGFQAIGGLRVNRRIPTAPRSGVDTLI